MLKTVPNLTSNVVNSNKYHPLAPVYMNVETDLHKKTHGLIPSKLGHQSKYFGFTKMIRVEERIAFLLTNRSNSIICDTRWPL